MAALPAMPIRDESSSSNIASVSMSNISPPAPGASDAQPSLASGSIRPFPQNSLSPASPLSANPALRPVLATHNSSSSARTEKSGTSATSAVSRASGESSRSRMSSRPGSSGSTKSNRSGGAKGDISGLSLVYARDRRGSVLTSLSKNGQVKAGSRRPGSGGKGASVGIELNALPPTKGVGITKEDEAMAKWRKWAVEQSNTPNTAELTPTRGRKASYAVVPPSPQSPSPAPSQQAAPAVTSALIANPPGTPSRSEQHPPQPLSSAKRSASVSAAAAASPSRGRGGSGDKQSNGPLALHRVDSPSADIPPDLETRRRSSFLSDDHADAITQPGVAGSSLITGWDTLDIYSTDTVRNLRDVELAVDEEVLARTAAIRQSSRLLSSLPRLSPLENPFVDIAPRLGSRRVRPVLLELVQALGHYIDTLWHVTHPDGDAKCPWNGGGHHHAEAGPSKIPNIPSVGIGGTTWTSRMLAAVEAGRVAGYVLEPDQDQLRFWRAEVEYALQDAGEVVGNHKKVARAFGEAFRRGQYGEVEDGNVFGDLDSGAWSGEQEDQAGAPDRTMSGHDAVTASNGRGLGKTEGGNIARLLNDLEEVLWGDAPPRPTDLSYELPADFDPYAAPAAGDLGGGTGTFGGDLMSPASTSLADFLGSPVTASTGAGPSGGMFFASPSPIMEEVLNMPDLIPSSPSPVLTDYVRSPLDVGNTTGRVPNHARHFSADSQFDDPLSAPSPSHSLAPTGQARPKLTSKGGDSYTNQSIAGMWAEHAALGDLNSADTAAGRRMTLEEIGKRRHAEWLAGRGKEWD